MEGHEVPKNVSDFEFHLIGDMTIKQFAYLGSGLGFAYLLFVVIGSSAPLLAWPLIVIFCITGVAYAFLPISDRPLDHWTLSFFRAIFNPTQRTWKSKLMTVDSPAFKNRLAVYFSQTESIESPSSQLVPKSSIVAQFTQFHPQTQHAQSVPSKSAPHVVIPAAAPKSSAPEPVKQAPVKEAPAKVEAKPLPSSQELMQTVELAKKTQIAQNNMLEAQKIVNLIKIEATKPGANSALYNVQLQESQKKLELFKNEMVRLSRELAVLSKTATVFEKRTIPVHVKPVSINLILTTTPNIINGIVTDSAGNYLEGVIVVTHDKEGLPVRALKTNKLGQFLAATPLPNGVYVISLEKEKLAFDVLEVSLEGQVMPAIRVSAKKGEALS